MPVIDANVALDCALGDGGFDRIGSGLVAPPLLWPEVRSALHVAVVRGALPRRRAHAALALLESGVVEEQRPAGLGTLVWSFADELGWTKTYDAEYLALARLARAPLMTRDARMARAAERLDIPLAAIPG